MMPLILSAISLGLLTWILLFLYNSLRTDKLREELFALRDELFDAAAGGAISFQAPAYRATRSMLNGAIRFSHRISTLRFIASRVVLPTSSRPHDPFATAIKSAPDADQEVCMAFIRRADRIVMSHMATSPLVLMLFLPPVLTWLLSKGGVDLVSFMLRTCRRQVLALHNILFAEGVTSQHNGQAPTFR